MKRLTYFMLVLLLLVSASTFGAWAPDAQAELEIETETRYVDAPTLSTLSSIQLYFTSKVIVEERDTDGGAPIYNYTAGYSNACGPLAGTAIVAFYDKYYPNLIPGWESYYPATGKYRLQITEYTTPVLNELYTLMQTNVKGDGVSESEFKTGLQAYVNKQGYAAGYTSASNGGSLDYSKCKAAIDSNKVIALFTTPGYVYDYVEYSDHDTYIESFISGNHIMYAYGYIQIKYYNSNGLYHTEMMLKVSTGHVSPSMAYYRIDSYNLEAAQIVNVG